MQPPMRCVYLGIPFTTPFFYMATLSFLTFLNWTLKNSVCSLFFKVQFKKVNKDTVFILKTESCVLF